MARLWHVLAFLCFVVAAVIAGFTKTWAVFFIAAGLALLEVAPAFELT